MLAKKLNSIQINRNIFIETHSQNMHVVISMHVYKNSKIITKSARKERIKPVAIYHRCATKPEHVSIPINKQTPFLVPHHVQVARGYLPQVAPVHTGEGGLGRCVEHPAYIELQNFVPWSAIRHSVYGHAVCRKINRTACSLFYLCHTSHDDRMWSPGDASFSYILYMHVLVLLTSWVLPPNHTI